MRLSWKAMGIRFLLAWTTYAGLGWGQISQPHVAVADGRFADHRLEAPIDLNGYFPLVVPTTVELWNERADFLRRRIRIATGLFPIPEKTPLNPVIHGKVQRPGFTVEKVYFESYPNHFVTGLLFRPDDDKPNGKRPAVLCPHGHGGRLQDHGVEKMASLIEQGEERFESSGRFPKIARCAQLARMGCVVFIFDMLGYADSQQISYELAHRFAKQRPELENDKRWGLYSAQAELRLQSVMGIQTWNSVRCLDFLQQLPDVDRERMAVTGGSGGGTQTILLCAIDERPVAAFPNGMVSTSMQGGCTCENCSLLRIDSGNVELAALFAPKPQAMTAANDWTKDMMTKGYPELQQLYEMLGAKENVFCREMLHFPHNYNIVTRETMYNWFNKHLELGLPEPIRESDFAPLTADEQSVWSDGHPKPEGGQEYELSLTNYLADQSDQQLAKLAPFDTASMEQFRNVVGTAFHTIVGRTLPAANDVERIEGRKEQREGYWYFQDRLRLKSRNELVSVAFIHPAKATWNGTVVLWLDGEGQGSLFSSENRLRPAVKRLVDNGTSVVGVDLFKQGDDSDEATISRQRVVSNPRESAAYTYCYNDTLFVRRVHDVYTVLGFLRDDEHPVKRMHLVGTNGAGPIAALVRALTGDRITKAIVDTHGFRFRDIRSYRDPNFMPGAVKYGDLTSMLALSAPNHLRILGEPSVPQLVVDAYKASGLAGAMVAEDIQDALDDLAE